MSSTQDLIGRLGESMVETNFSYKLKNPKKYPGYPLYPFHALFLGDKHELFDLVVFLLDVNSKPTGGYFFVQVKSTDKPIKGKSLPAGFTKQEVIRALNFKCPSYVIAVKTGFSLKHIYAKGVSSARKNGIYKIKQKDSLKLDETKIKIYDEVNAYFSKRKHTFSSSI